MERQRLFAVATAAVLLLVTSLTPCAQADTPPPPKALKYHKVLVRRPSPGYLFDRFFNAWLDEQSSGELEGFLVQQAESGRPADGLLLAFYYVKQGEELKAIERFRVTLSKDPGNADAWYQKAVLESRTLNLDTAVKDLKKAAQANPKEDLALRIAKLRGQLLVRSNRREEALKVFQDLIKQNPSDEQLAEDVIEMLIGEGLYAEAAADSQKLIARTTDPYRKVLRRLRLGDIQQKSGKRDAAVATYQSTLKEVGAESWLEREVLSQIENTFRREGNLASLKKQYADLVEALPQRVAIRRGYAGVLAETGQAPKAIEQFQEVLRITPGERGNQEAFIRLLLKTGDPEQARKQLGALIKQHPEDAELYVQLAELCSAAGDDAAVSEAVDKFLAASDKGEYEYLRAARLLERLGLAERAETKYAALTKAFPDSPSAKEAHAAFLYKSGDKKAALDLWKSSIDPTDAQQAVRTARALATRQEHAAAYEILSAKRGSFRNNPLFLAQLVDAALASDHADDAIPLAVHRVDLAEDPGALEDALSQAVRAVERGERVAQEIAKLTQLDRLTPQRTCLLSELYESTGDLHSADQALAPLLESGDPLGVVQQINLCRGRRDWQGAIEGTKRLINLPGGRKSRNLRSLVEFYEKANELKHALEWAPEWKKLSPGSTSPWLAESRLLLNLGRSEQAIDTLREALRKYNNAPELRSRLAQLYESVGRLSDAERLYWREHDDSSDPIERLRSVEQLARLAQQQGKEESLITTFQERQQENRTSIEPLMALSTIYQVIGDSERQVDVLGEAAKLRPDDVPLLQQIARIEQRDGKWREAEKMLRRAIEADNTGRAKQQLIRLHLSTGNLEEGYNLMASLLEQEQTDPRKIESLAEAMIGQRDWERAAEFLGRYVDRWPKDFRLRYMHALTLEETDAVDQASQAFLKVVQAQQDASPGAPKAGRPTSNYYEQINRFAPAGVAELMQASSLHYTAYNYRQVMARATATSSLSFTMGQAASGLGRSMPADASQARLFAVAHLGELAEAMDNQRREQLHRDLTRCGVPEVDLLMALCARPQNRNLALARAAEEYSDREALAAYFVISNAYARQAGYPLSGAFDRFEQSSPQLALLAYLGAAVAGEDCEPLSDRAAALLKRIESPQPYFVSQVVSRLNQAKQRGSAPPKAVEEPLVASTIDWFGSVRNSQPYGRSVYSQLAVYLRATGRPDAYVQLLDEEVAAYRDNPQSMQQPRRPNTATLFGRQGQMFLTAPTLPPALMLEFPAHVQSMAGGARRYSSRLGFSSGLIAQRVVYAGAPLGRAAQATDMKGYAEAIAKAKDPTLRLLLAHAAGKEQVAQEALEELLASESPTRDTLLLAAGWEATHDRTAKALEYLELLSKLPLNRDTRRLVDSYTVNATVKLGDPNPEQASAGRAAALRLSRGMLMPAESSKLASAMLEIGLEDEASRLTANASTRVVGLTRPGLGRRLPRGRGTQKDPIQRMLDSEKKEQAVRLLSRDFRMSLRQFAQYANNPSYLRRQHATLKKRVDKYQLADEVLAHFKPADIDQHAKHALYAEALAVFGKEKEARESFEKALELRPDDDTYRIRLIQADLANGSVDQVMARVKQLNPRSATMLAGAVTSAMNDRETTIEKRLLLVDVAVELLDMQGSSPSASMSWAETLRRQLGGAQRIGSTTQVSLYMPRGASTDKKSKELFDKRVEMHDRLCRKMIAIPPLARSGFAGLAAVSEVEGEQPPELRELATKILLGAKPSGGYRGAMRYASTGSGYVPERSPEEYLVRCCWQEKDWGLLDDKIVSALEDSNEAATLKTIQLHRALFTSDAQGFSQAAREYVKHAPHYSPAGIIATYPELKVHEVWQDRGLEIDITPVMLAPLEEWTQGHSGSSLPPYLTAYAEGLSQRSGVDKAAEFLEQIATVVVGPRDKREDLIASHFTPNRYVSGTPGGRMYAFSRFLNQASSRGPLVIPVLRLLSEGGVQPLAQNLSSSLRTGLRRAIPEDPSQTIEMLQGLGLLAGLSELDIAPIGPSLEDATLLDALANALRSHKNKKKLLELIAQREESFGALYIKCSLDGKTDTLKEVLGYCGQGIDTLEELPPERRHALAASVMKLLKQHRPDKPFEGDAAKAFEWVQRQSLNSGLQLVTKINLAKRFENLGVAYNKLDAWLAQVLSTAAKADPKAASRSYFKVAELYEDAIVRGVVNRRYSYSVAQEMFRQVWQRTDSNTLDRTRIGLAIIEGEGAKRIVLQRHYVDEVLRPLEQRLTKLQQGNLRENKDSAELIQQFLKLQQDEHLDPDSVLLAKSYIDCLQGINPDELATAKSWLAEHEDQPGVVVAQAAVDFLVVRNNRRRDSDSQEGFSVIDRLLLDKQRSLASRLALGESLWSRENDRLPLATRLALVGLLQEACQCDTPLREGTHQNYVWCLKGVHSESPSDSAVRDAILAWVDRFVAKPVVVKPGYSSSIHSPNSQSSVIQMLGLVYAIGERESAHRLLSRYRHEIGSRRETIAMLTREGEIDQAAALGRTYWRSFVSTRLSPAPVAYDQQLHENLLKLTEKLGEGATPLVVRAAIARIPNAPDLDDLPTRSQRLEDLAREFKDGGFGALPSSTMFLMLVGAEPSALEVLRGTIDATVGKLDVVSFAIGGSPLLKPATEVLVAHAERQAEQGDPAPAMNLLAEAVLSANNSVSNSYRINNLFYQIDDELSRPLLENAGKFDQEDFKAIAQATRKMFAAESRVRPYQNRSLTTLMLVANAKGATDQQYQEWLKTLPSNTKNSLKRYGTNNEVWKAALAGVPDNDLEQDAAEQTATAIAQVLDRFHATGLVNISNVAKASLRINGGTRHLDELEKAIGKDRLPEIAPQIAQAATHKLQASAVLANHFRRRKQHDAAAKAWANAYESAPETDSKSRLLLRAEEIESLHSANQKDPARKLLEETSLDGAEKSVQDRYHSLKRTLDGNPIPPPVP